MQRENIIVHVCNCHNQNTSNYTLRTSVSTTLCYGMHNHRRGTYIPSADNWGKERKGNDNSSDSPLHPVETRYKGVCTKVCHLKKNVRLFSIQVYIEEKMHKPEGCAGLYVAALARRVPRSGHRKPYVAHLGTSFYLFLGTWFLDSPFCCPTSF